MRVVDEIAHATGWIEEKRAARTSHALEVDGRVWLFDVVDWPGLDARVRELGEPAAVVQLLDRHERDCAAVAQRLDVPHHRRTPAVAGNAVRAPSGRPVSLVARSRALVGGAPLAPRRRRGRHDSVLLRRRGACRRPPLSSALAAALAPRPRPRPSARGARRGDPPPSGGAGERAADRATSDSALADGPAAHLPRGLARAGEQARPDEPRRRLQPRIADRRVERLGERRSRERRGAPLGGRIGVERRALPRRRGRWPGSAPPSTPAASPVRAPSRRSARSTRSSAFRRGRSHPRAGPPRRPRGRA